MRWYWGGGVASNPAVLAAPFSSAFSEHSRLRACALGHCKASVSATVLDSFGALDK